MTYLFHAWRHTPLVTSYVLMPKKCIGVYPSWIPQEWCSVVVYPYGTNAEDARYELKQRKG